VSDTANPYAAQAHARAQAGTRAEAMPTIPATAAVRLPDGVAADEVVWDETLAPGGYASRQVARGTRLRLTDLSGDASASLLLFNAERPVERLNIADTLKVQWNGYLGQGRLLLSDMGRVLASLVEDTAGTHDAFCGASNRASNARKYGDGDNHGRPPQRPRPLLAGRGQVRPGPQGHPPLPEPVQGGADRPRRRHGDRCRSLSARPLRHPAGRDGPDRGGRQLPARAGSAPRLRGHAAARHRLARPGHARADPIRNATPEGLRAFLNVEDYYRR
jgi:hypothetical protein